MMRSLVHIFVMALPLFLAACQSTKAPAPVTVYGASVGPGSAGAHTVIEEDTLWSIAQRYRMDMRGIIELNRLSPPYALAVGQRIKLPPPRDYKVRQGDTIYGISRTFAVSMSEVSRMNALSSPYILHEGQVLRLPSPSPRRGEGRGEGGKKIASSVISPSPKPSRSREKAVSVPPPGRSGGKFAWPVEGRVVSSYGPKKDGLHNDGINIAAPKGTPVRSAENGVVVYAGQQLEGYGNLVLVRHADRWMSAYAHMDRILIGKGQKIKKGQTLGTVGSTGSVETPQLHFEIRRGTRALDPKKYL